MIKFFRKIRYDLIEKNKTGKYLKYAVGEIVLVIIGILLALQINNWNEGRKAKAYEEKVYKQIYKDIRTDSLNLANVISFYKQKDTLMNRILYDSVPSIAYDTINNENQFTFPYGITLITRHSEVTNSKKGYELFKTLNTRSIETDSLSFSIEGYYLLAIDNENYERVKSTTGKNIRDFQQKDWFLDLALERELNPSYLNYIKSSDDFKTRVFDYQIYAIKNYTRRLKKQLELAEALKETIKNRLEK